MSLVRRQQPRPVAVRTNATGAAYSRDGTGSPSRRQPIRHHCTTEALERRQLMAATPVALAIESHFGIEAGRAFPATGDVGPSVAETYDLAVLPSGKTLVAGGYVVRLGTDGTHDRAFGDSGYVHAADPGGGRWTWWNALLPAANDRILVGGTLIDPAAPWWRVPLLARYTADGAPDPAFGVGTQPGVAYLPFGTTAFPDAVAASILDVAALPDGSYLAAGFVRYEDRPADPQDIALWKVRHDGTLDLSFGEDGRLIHDLADGAESVLSLVVRGDGGFFAATTGGVLSFDSADAVAGNVGAPGPATIAPGAAGTLVIARATDDGNVRVQRFLGDGTPDPTFGGPAGARVDFAGRAGAPTSVLVHPNGYTLVAAPNLGTATSAFDVVALTPEGAIESAFGTNGRITERGELDTPTRLAPGSGGRLVVGAGDSVMDLFLRSFVLDPGITLDDGGPYAAVNEGSPLAVSAFATYAGGTIDRYEWDAGGQTYNGTWFEPDATGANTTVTFADDSLPHHVTLKVTTADGLSVVRELPVEVRNVAPSLTGVNVPSPAPLGTQVTVTGTVTDPGRDALGVTVNFGDGTSPVTATVQSDGRFTASHAFSGRGSFRVTITAADDEGGSTTVQRDVVIADVVGNVFRDTQDDGRRSPTDEPVVGATVYVDSDGDGTRDAGEPSAETDAAGQYYFLELDNGTYFIRLDTPPGFRATTLPGQGGPLTLDDDGPGARREFGLTDRARISGIVFDDANANAVLDGAELLLQGSASTVYLDLNNDGWRDTGEPVATAATEGPSGEYVFANLAPGTYTVRLNSALSTGGAILRERAQTFPFERGGQTGHVVTVAAGAVSAGNDFGTFFGNTPATGVAYNDLNANGNREAPPEPMQVRVVYLDFDNDGVLDPDESRVRTANSVGNPASYLMPLVRDRTYTLRTVVPAGWTQTEPAGGAPYVFTVNQQNTVVLQGLDFGTRRTAPAAVVGRNLFYYKSVFGGTQISHTENDRAVAPDKSALLPGGQAGFGNVSTYSRGINGLMIDFNDLGSSSFAPGDLFAFDVGDGTPTGWKPLSPVGVSSAVRRGAGVGGSDRVVVTFPDGAIQNKWLRVTVRAGPISNLAAPDVFYFGHLHGDAGGDASPLRTDALDLAAVRRAMGRPATITDPADFNRDGRVDSVDLAAARKNAARELSAPVTMSASPAAALPNDPRRTSKRRIAWDELA